MRAKFSQRELAVGQDVVGPPDDVTGVRPRSPVLGGLGIGGQRDGKLQTGPKARLQRAEIAGQLAPVDDTRVGRGRGHDTFGDGVGQHHRAISSSWLELRSRYSTKSASPVGSRRRSRTSGAAGADRPVTGLTEIQKIASKRQDHHQRHRQDRRQQQARPAAPRGGQAGPVPVGGRACRSWRGAGGPGRTARRARRLTRSRRVLRSSPRPSARPVRRR
jgi:hypothetical protein